MLYPPISFALVLTECHFRERERERTRNDAAPVIRNFIWEGNESGGGRDWFSPLLFLFGYTEEAEGLEKNARMECARFFDESCDSWGEVLMKLF